MGKTWLDECVCSNAEYYRFMAREVGHMDSQVDMAIRKAVREALEEAAVLCEGDGLNGIRLGAAIRKLGDIA